MTHQVKLGTKPVNGSRAYFLCKCDECDWLGSSEEATGGGELYYCPICGAQEPDEQVGAAQVFNTMLAHIDAQSARIAELEAQQPAVGVPDALSDIAAERRRQIETEGWTPEHDDQYDNHILAYAAGCYAMYTMARPEDPIPVWPWAASWWKPSADPRRNWIKAGALIVAEIERFDRAVLAAHKAQEGGAV